MNVTHPVHHVPDGHARLVQGGHHCAHPGRALLQGLGKMTNRHQGRSVKVGGFGTAAISAPVWRYKARDAA